MEILICTYGRARDQITYHELPPEIQRRTTLVVQHRELDLYPNYNTIVLPDYIRNLPQTRQWLLESSSTRCLQLDDDLVFATRRTDDRTKFQPCTGQDIVDMIQSIEDTLQTYAHVGLCAREGGNRHTEPVSRIGRQMRVHGYNREVLRRHHVKHDRLPDMEDFDVTLQLLKLGYPNMILNNWCHNQSGSNTFGGCSEYRTIETHNRDVEKLADLHPGFVTVVQKDNLGEWGKRLDVRIQWKKCYESNYPNVGEAE